MKRRHFLQAAMTASVATGFAAPPTKSRSKAETALRKRGVTVGNGNPRGFYGRDGCPP